MHSNPNISSRDDERLERLELQPYLGEYLRFRGTVCNVTSPFKGIKHVCLYNVEVTPINNDVPFSEAEKVFVKHIWFDVSDCKHMVHRLYQEVEGTALVIQYSRKDRSEAFGMRLDNKLTSQKALMDSVMNVIERIKFDQRLSVDGRAHLVNTLIEKTKDIINGDGLVLFDLTRAQFIAEIDQAKSRMMMATGVMTTLNRSGRRLMQKRCRPKAQRPPAIGMA